MSLACVSFVSPTYGKGSMEKTHVFGEDEKLKAIDKEVIVRDTLPNSFKVGMEIDKIWIYLLKSILCSCFSNR